LSIIVASVGNEIRSSNGANILGGVPNTTKKLNGRRMLNEERR
jgi:hypothetical protein